jgi:hypothetical protein
MKCDQSSNHSHARKSHVVVVRKLNQGLCARSLVPYWGSYSEEAWTGTGQTLRTYKDTHKTIDPSRDASLVLTRINQNLAPILLPLQSSLVYAEPRASLDEVTHNGPKASITLVEQLI